MTVLFRNYVNKWQSRRINCTVEAARKRRKNWQTSESEDMLLECDRDRKRHKKARKRTKYKENERIEKGGQMRTPNTSI
jgi:hypothetical protein